MPFYNYGDLSSDSSSCGSSSGEENDYGSSVPATQQQDIIPNDLWSHCILHLDIDCFYCQCEEIDRDLRNNPRPLAIGQKHIIVTCNYEARRHGVKKLQLRKDAMAACPSLWIVEGSDLRNYKRHSRSVYEAFRRALKEIANEIIGGNSIPSRKGTMDEMMANLSPAVERIMNDNMTAKNFENKNDGRHHQTFYIFGETASRTRLVEDQTGQETSVSFGGRNDNSRNPITTLPLSRRNVHDSYGTEQDRQRCIKRLDIASKLVARICQYIFEQTGFCTTGGVSVSPLLAKLASDLNKPKSINLLYPWRSSHIFYSMPLRKMQNVGGRTMRALEATLELYSTLPSSSQGDKQVRTILDLLRIPRESIESSLEGIQGFQESSGEQCDLLLQRCRGLDTSEIVDDDGGLPKTVSVENSFQRNTICNTNLVQRAMDDLLHRLPLMLNDRTSWAPKPDCAFPTTIRMTIRMVDQNLVGGKRRPFVTKSKQSTISNGKALILEKDSLKQSVLLRQLAEPLLSQLLQDSIKRCDINVTRLNIALTNFQDVLNQHHPTISSFNEPLLSSMSEKRQSYSNSNSQQPVTKKVRPSIMPTKHGFLGQSATPTHSASAYLSPNAATSSFKSDRIQGNPSSSSKKGKATRIDSFFRPK